ncbi:hypothetical protein [Streptomyces europaeiscabiei]|uniref:hypothetical protein n=1 Tax=Streptomyces europaeiscabiei TaxID=146819 RepID=UPI0038F76BB8
MSVGDWLGITFGGIGTVVAVVGLWFYLRHRRRDREDLDRSAIEALVRECESRRVLWNPVAWEEPERCYASVQDLRQAIRRARGRLPPDIPGITEIDTMKNAAEEFCNEYERLNGQNFMIRSVTGRSSTERMIARLRSIFVPALENLRRMHGIPAGRRPMENPLGPTLGEIDIRPSTERRHE